MSEQDKAAQAAHAEAMKAQGLSEETFFFRPKPVKKDALGNPEALLPGEELVKVEGKEDVKKRAPFKAFLPYTNTDKLVALLQDEKTAAAILTYLVDRANDAIFEAAQAQVNSIIGESKAPAQELLDLAKLDLYALATAPKTTFNRGIPKEIWAAFKTDFIEVMTANYGVSVDGATKASKLIADDRFQSIKTATKLLETLQTYLNNWFVKTSPESQEKFLPIFEESLKKIETYTTQGEQNILDSIL